MGSAGPSTARSYDDGARNPNTVTPINTGASHAGNVPPPAAPPPQTTLSEVDDFLPGDSFLDTDRDSAEPLTGPLPPSGLNSPNDPASAQSLRSSMEGVEEPLLEPAAPMENVEEPMDAAGAMELQQEQQREREAAEYRMAQEAAYAAQAYAALYEQQQAHHAQQLEYREQQQAAAQYFQVMKQRQEAERAMYAAIEEDQMALAKERQAEYKRLLALEEQYRLEFQKKVGEFEDASAAKRAASRKKKGKEPARQVAGEEEEAAGDSDVEEVLPKTRDSALFIDLDAEEEVELTKRVPRTPPPSRRSVQVPAAGGAPPPPPPPPPGTARSAASAASSAPGPRAPPMANGGMPSGLVAGIASGRAGLKSTPNPEKKKPPASAASNDLMDELFNRISSRRRDMNLNPRNSKNSSGSGSGSGSARSDNATS